MTIKIQEHNKNPYNIELDDQGGGMSIEVLEDYDELYDTITSKSEYVKRRIGEKNVL